MHHTLFGILLYIVGRQILNFLYQLIDIKVLKFSRRAVWTHQSPCIHNNCQTKNHGQFLKIEGDSKVIRRIFDGFLLLKFFHLIKRKLLGCAQTFRN